MYFFSAQYIRGGLVKILEYLSEKHRRDLLSQKDFHRWSNDTKNEDLAEV